MLAALLIGTVATLTTRQPRTVKSVAPRILVALAAAATTAIVSGLTYNRLLVATSEWIRASLGHGDHQYVDPQGALLIMAPYQIGLFLGLWVAWNPRPETRRALLGLAVLLASQPLALLAAGEWVAHTGLEPHVAAIRAWSVVWVLLIGAWVVGGHRWFARRRALSSPEPQHG